MEREMEPDTWLVFVDTNILLDFYRLPGEGAKRQIDALIRHQSSLILSKQVRMEFLKNRQNAILDGLSSLKEPQNPAIPPILVDYAPSQTLKELTNNAKLEFKKLQTKLDSILASPQQHDPVFQGLEKIFSTEGPLNLTDQTKERQQIIQRAEERFKLGYPPRKKNDTSIGDSVNWEWLMHCAQHSSKKTNVLIVSRDTDFGAIKKSAYLNDWLQTEFVAKTKKGKQIELTNKLTKALERLDEHVSQEDLEAEEALLSGDKKYGRPKPYGRSAFFITSNEDSNDELDSFLSNWTEDN